MAKFINYLRNATKAQKMFMSQVIIVMKLLLVAPATNAVSERSFSALRRNKTWLRLRLHGAIYRPDSFVLMLRYCVNLKVISYESTSLNRIADDKSHRVIVT